MDKLKAQLKEQILEALSLDEMKPEEIDDNAPLFGEGLGLDSIDALELIVLMEKQYGIKLSFVYSSGSTTQNVFSVAFITHPQIFKFQSKTGFFYTFRFKNRFSDFGF